jgi:hypothetical protein
VSFVLTLIAFPILYKSCKPQRICKCAPLFFFLDNGK